jgi:uncharacterized protein (TIGR04255 family)
MPEALHYPGAPIVEAALVIRVRPSIVLDRPAMTAIGALHARDYPFRGRPPRFTWEVQDDNSVVKGGESDSAEQLLSEDKKQCVEIRPESFAFSRFAPYDRWDTFSAEARRLWTDFREACKPDAIEGVALHYVNRIGVPPQAKLEDYFNVYIHLTEKLPQTVLFFVAVAAFALKDPDTVVTVAQQPGPAKPGEETPIVLDIAAHLQIGRDIKEDELWTLLGKIRDQKNFVFETCITDRVREIIRQCPN